MAALNGDRTSFPSEHSRAAEEKGVLHVLRCAIENSGDQVYSLQSVGRRELAHIENYMPFVVGVIVALAVIETV